MLKRDCDDVMLEIYSDQSFQWPHEDFDCQFLAYELIA